MIDLERIEDERGFFARAWAADDFVAHGLEPTIAQMNMSTTLAAGTFRGFHWQDPPFGEIKTVRCIAGSVYNCVVDMRPESPTFQQWFGVEMSADNLRMLYVPAQFANGFLFLEDNTTLLYNVSEPYAAGNEHGFRYDDQTIAVDWPREISTVSEKDMSWPALA